MSRVESNEWVDTVGQAFETLTFDTPAGDRSGPSWVRRERGTDGAVGLHWTVDASPARLASLLSEVQGREDALTVIRDLTDVRTLSRQEAIDLIEAREFVSLVKFEVEDGTVCQWRVLEHGKAQVGVFAKNGKLDWDGLVSKMVSTSADTVIAKHFGEVRKRLS